MPSGTSNGMGRKGVTISLGPDCTIFSNGQFKGDRSILKNKKDQSPRIITGEALQYENNYGGSPKLNDIINCCHPER